MQKERSHVPFKEPNAIPRTTKPTPSQPPTYSGDLAPVPFKLSLSVNLGFVPSPDADNGGDTTDPAADAEAADGEENDIVVGFLGGLRNVRGATVTVGLLSSRL